ncbi:MAG: hypothetical protein ACYC1S_13010 [Gemmatimonadaceae bacterium]
MLTVTLIFVWLARMAAFCCAGVARVRGTPSSFRRGRRTRALLLVLVAREHPAEEGEVHHVAGHARHTHSGRCGCERIPIPLVSSRSSSARIALRLRSSSAMPQSRATLPGETRARSGRVRLRVAGVHPSAGAKHAPCLVRTRATGKWVAAEVSGDVSCEMQLSNPALLTPFAAALVPRGRTRACGLSDRLGLPFRTGARRGAVPMGIA